MPRLPVHPPASLVLAAHEGFERVFRTQPSHFGFGPGRVELLGNHTDYNGGCVICAAVDLGIVAVGRPRSDRKVRIASHQFPTDKPLQSDLDHLQPDPATHWADYIRGVIVMAARKKLVERGLDLYVAADLPPNSGLSSSAAVEMATLQFLLAAAGRALSPMDAAKLARKAENEFVGVACGLMDQFASAHGQADSALYLDCLSEEHAALPLGPDCSLIVIDSQVKHALADGQYGRLRALCESAAAKINKATAKPPGTHSLLRHVSLHDLETHRALLSPDEAPRATHVVREQARVLDGRHRLQRGDVVGFAGLMTESHESSSTLFGNSCPELDQIIELARQTNAHPEARGAWLGGKLSGGGFGGATVHLVRRAQAQAFEQVFTEIYRAGVGKPPRILPMSAGAGAAGGSV